MREEGIYWKTEPTSMNRKQAREQRIYQMQTITGFSGTTLPLVVSNYTILNYNAVQSNAPTEKRIRWDTRQSSAPLQETPIGHNIYMGF